MLTIKFGDFSVSTNINKMPKREKSCTVGNKVSSLGSCTLITSYLINKTYYLPFYSGKWVLSKDYIVDSSKAGKWLKEEQYQWGIRHINEPIGQSSMAKAPARWHRTVQETGKKAFSGWRVLIMVENKKRKPAVYKRYKKKLGMGLG